MESEKVKEIKNALECWQESVMLSTDENYVSHKVYNREILDYINELERENERLSNTEIGELIEENEKLAKQCEDWCEIILKKRNQIVELKDRIAELEKGNEALSFAVKQGFNDCQAKKLKQFAERLKIECVNKIHETLKEFIGEKS